MIFSIDRLCDHLWHQFGILPEWVRLDTHFRQDLQLSECEIVAFIQHLTHSMGITFPVDTGRHLTDVFDLMVYVLLRSQEEIDVANYFGEPICPINTFPANQLTSLNELVAKPSNPN